MCWRFNDVNGGRADSSLIFLKKYSEDSKISLKSSNLVAHKAAVTISQKARLDR